MKKLSIIIGAAFLVACTLLFAQSNYTHLAEYDATIYAQFLSFTNGCATATNYPMDSVEYLIMRGTLTNVIRRLAKDGHICEVLGHVWDAVPHVTLEYRPDGHYPQHRKCRLCGKEETKEPGAWK